MKNPETKRRRGGQPGNTNAVKSGRYTADVLVQKEKDAQLLHGLRVSLRLLTCKEGDSSPSLHTYLLENDRE